MPLLYVNTTSPVRAVADGLSLQVTIMVVFTLVAEPSNTLLSRVIHVSDVDAVHLAVPSAMMETVDSVAEKVIELVDRARVTSRPFCTTVIV